MFQPRPWIPAIPLDSLGFPGIPGYFGNSRGPFLEVGIPNNYRAHHQLRKIAIYEPSRAEELAVRAVKRVET